MTEFMCDEVGKLSGADIIADIDVTLRAVENRSAAAEGGVVRGYSLNRQFKLILDG
ncbi:hypothetical protein [Burkholderia cenocepacia]|uniref:hypothetical protein n=1 Tax=Burkholderia cenocepacia TaxID=95486 RepID=UPI001F4B8C03|nr:hypothetical protein [Burkholderia cenocepacia]